MLYIAQNGGVQTNFRNHWTENIPDQNAFLFSLKSNGRINGMKQFKIQNTSHTFILGNGSNPLFTFGGGHDIIVYKQSCRTQSYCKQSSTFDYAGLENPLVGGNGSGRKSFIPKRITVIQMI